MHLSALWTLLTPANKQWVGVQERGIFLFREGENSNFELEEVCHDPIPQVSPKTYLLPTVLFVALHWAEFHSTWVFLFWKVVYKTECRASVLAVNFLVESLWALPKVASPIQCFTQWITTAFTTVSYIAATPEKLMELHQCNTNIVVSNIVVNQFHFISKTKGDLHSGVFWDQADCK